MALSPYRRHPFAASLLACAALWPAASAHAQGVIRIAQLEP